MKPFKDGMKLLRCRRWILFLVSVLHAPMWHLTRTSLPSSFYQFSTAFSINARSTSSATAQWCFRRRQGQNHDVLRGRRGRMSMIHRSHGGARNTTPTTTSKQGFTYSANMSTHKQQSSSIVYSLSRHQQNGGGPSTTTVLQNSRRPEWDWEGDDIRWLTRIGRKMRGTIGGSPFSSMTRCRNILIWMNTVMFVYQSILTVNTLRTRYPSYWPKHSVSMILDTLWGSSIQGALTMDFAYSTKWSRIQPHRYLTSGFLHGGILHLLLNMDALRRLPVWLESGLGPALYVTTYLFSIITGNLGHSIGLSNAGNSVCLGSSGGICGLYGLMYINLARMGNTSAASRVLKGMAILFLYGVLVPDVSNAAHIGGFLGGVLVGLLCGPSYEKSYALRRKWSLEVDTSPKDYRIAMGFGTKPTLSSKRIPIRIIWVMTAMAMVSIPKLRSMPQLIIKGLIHPGSVYRQLFYG